MTDPLEKRLHELRELSREYAEAESERSYLEHFRKSKLAMLQKQAMTEGHESVAAQEREARSHPEYLQVLEGLREATHRAEKAKWELQIAKLGAGLWQTQRADERAERKGYGA